MAWRQAEGLVKKRDVILSSGRTPQKAGWHAVKRDTCQKRKYSSKRWITCQKAEGLVKKRDDMSSSGRTRQKAMRKGKRRSKVTAGDTVKI